MNAVQKSTLISLHVINAWHKAVVVEAMALWDQDGQGEFLCFLKGYMDHCIEELNESSRWN